MRRHKRKMAAIKDSGLGGDRHDMSRMNAGRTSTLKKRWRVDRINAGKRSTRVRDVVIVRNGKELVLHPTKGWRVP